MIPEEKSYCRQFTFFRTTKLGNGSLLKELKRKILLQQENKCKFCPEELQRYFLSKYHMDLDHIIPIAIGGSLTEEKNLQILCFRCHKNKTAKDVAIIAFLKKTGLLEKVSPQRWQAFVKPEKLAKIYFYFYKKMEETQKRRQYEN